MRMQLRTLDKLPSTLPIWQAILDDLGDPPAHRVAKALGVSVRTVYRWNADREAPRCAVMALYWLTRWGQSQVNVQASNDASLACGYVEALRQENQQLRTQVEHVMTLSTGAANAPLIGRPYAPRT